MSLLKVSKSQPPTPEKYEHQPPTPLQTPRKSNSCFPQKNRSFEGDMKYCKVGHHPKSYYFVLSYNFLLGAASIDASKLSLVLPLDGKSINVKENVCDSFAVIGNKKDIHYFQVSNESSQKQWVECLQKACKLSVTDIYRKMFVIGSGSSGTTVFAATHRSTKKRVAIKHIRKKNISDKSRFSNEISIMRTLQNQPCIVRYLDIFESKKSLYLVMEWCEGGDLYHNLSKQRAQLNTSIVCHVMHQLARAVDYMHKKGIIHRDLKPENILCVKPGCLERIKVADFGISKYIGDLNNTPVGTLTYAAPELLNGSNHGKPVDYWSLGIIMHIMLCGYSPWKSKKNEIEISREITNLNTEIELNDKDFLHVSQTIKDLLIRLLSKNAKTRATVSEILKLKKWKEKTNFYSYYNARKNLKVHIYERNEQCSRRQSTEMVEANLYLMNKVYRNGDVRKRKKSRDDCDILNLARKDIERYLNKINQKNKNKNKNDSDSYDYFPNVTSNNEETVACKLFDL